VTAIPTVIFKKNLRKINKNVGHEAPTSTYPNSYEELSAMTYIYTVYKTTNQINGKYYIGKHKTTVDNINDDYLGSGIILKQAIEKYGKENFTKEVIKIFNDENSAFDYEQELVNKLLVEDKNCYNIMTGGLGGRTLSDESKQKLSLINKGKPRSDKIKKKISVTLKGRKISKEHKKKLSDAKKGKACSEETKKKLSLINTGKKISEETKKKLSLGNYITPHGTFIGAEAAARADNETLNASTIRKYCKNSDTPMKRLGNKKPKDCGYDFIPKKYR
jgi:group I intron endonuclease